MAVSKLISSLANDCIEARNRVSADIIKTPLIPSKLELSEKTQVFYKSENFQITGSFKVRGALSKLSKLPTVSPVITASSGNHGIACSYAAKTTGHKLTVVLPENVSRAKLSKIESFGTKTILNPGDSGLAERKARELASSGNYTYVSPYNDNLIMAGQGTIALEILEQQPEVDNIFVSMGGGGLISGIGSVIKSFSANAKIIGVSAINSAALAASISAGNIVETEHLETLADGCAGGVDEDSLTLPIATQVIDKIIHCSEVEILESLQILAWKEKVLVEGSAALALAGFLKKKKNYEGQNNVILLCGANFDKDLILEKIS